MAILAYIRGPRGFRRPVTDDDALWAARMLLGEAGSNAWKTNEGYAILWTMLNRWVLTSDSLPYMSFGEFIQQYSKAINPAFLQGGARDVSPEETKQERRRAVRRTLTWAQLDPQLRKVVYDVFQGRVPVGPYVGLVYFGAPSDPRDPDVVGPVVLPGVPTTGNVFYRVPQTTSWTASTVTLKPEGRIMTMRYAGIGLGIGLVAVAVLLGVQFSSGESKHEAIRKWRKPLPPQRGGVHRSKKEYVRSREKERGRREDW